MTASDLAPANLLLNHCRRVNPALDDALLLTFNLDLAFFEREALGLLQLTGARITVLADARVTRHDLYAVHRAGTGYLPGLTACAGAFHPKLLALVGTDDVSVSIGSGNLTLPGWRGNDELWSVHRSSADGGSTVPSQVADFLSQLPESVRLVEPVTEALRRVAVGLRRFSGDDDTCQVVSSLSEPIIDQLPTGPVDELILYAPFQDEGAAAIARLIDRFEPQYIQVAFQPESTRTDGAAVARLIAGRGELVALPNSPYRHGKLIEWTCNSRRWALTGSPNLSSSALLRSARQGANIELGVISPIADSLVPKSDGYSVSTEELPVFNRSDDTRRHADVIIAATRVQGGVEITLARPLSRPGTIEYSFSNDSPELWHRGDPVDALASDVLLATDLDGGSRVRICFDDFSSTSVVFVLDLASVLRTRASRQAGPALPEIEEVLSNPETAHQFWSIVRALGAKVKAPRSAGKGSTDSSAAAGNTLSVGDWAAYLERCRGQLGSTLMAFALGLPALGTRQQAISPAIDWDSDGDLDDVPGTLDDDQAAMESAAIELPESVDLTKMRMTDQARGQYRSFAKRAADSFSTTEPHESLVLLRLLLLLAAGGVWTAADLSWVKLVLKGVEELQRCESHELESAAGSLAATALAVVDHAYATSGSRTDRSEFRRASNKVAHLMIAADEERIAEYGSGLAYFGAATDPTTVLRLRDLLVNDNPLDLSLKQLDDLGIAYELDGRLIRLSKPMSNPLLFARQTRSSIEELRDIAVRAVGKRQGEWVLLVSSTPDEVEIVSGTLPRSARVDHSRVINGRSSAVASTTVRDPIPNDTAIVLARLGISL
jgi:hypothetical protein